MDRDSRPPSFQFYPRDFLSDPAVMAMRPAEVGAYIRLLCVAWLGDEPGVLPDDDDFLSTASGMGAGWPSSRPAVSRAFRVADGRWVQKRMVMEREAQVSYRNGASSGGRRRMAQLSDSERVAMAKSAADARWHASRMPAGCQHCLCFKRRI